MVFGCVFAVFYNQKTVKKFASGDLPRKSAAAGKKEQKRKQNFEQRLVAQHVLNRQENAVIRRKNPSFCLLHGVSSKPLLNIL